MGMSQRTKEFKVVNRRFQFRCPNCEGTRSYFVNDLRRKTVKCFKCGQQTRCVFNRRTDKRDYQSGKIILTTRNGKEIDVNLKNVSFYGAGIEIPPGIPSTILSVGQEVNLRCSWNSQLLRNRRYIIQNISGQQVGVRRAKI